MSWEIAMRVLRHHYDRRKLYRVIKEWSTVSPFNIGADKQPLSYSEVVEQVNNKLAAAIARATNEGAACRKCSDGKAVAA